MRGIQGEEILPSWGEQDAAQAHPQGASRPFLSSTSSNVPRPHPESRTPGDPLSCLSLSALSGTQVASARSSSY